MRTWCVADLLSAEDVVFESLGLAPVRRWGLDRSRERLTRVRSASDQEAAPCLGVLCDQRLLDVIGACEINAAADAVCHIHASSPQRNLLLPGTDALVVTTHPEHYVPTPGMSTLAFVETCS